MRKIISERSCEDDNTHAVEKNMKTSKGRNESLVDNALRGKGVVELTLS
jgi:hypothetical protein